MVSVLTIKNISEVYMNQKEWKKSGKFPGKYKWYNQTRKFQRSLCYEHDPNANIIHHLRDTEEQRKYNDEHYEYWGFNQDGTFEYGKYVVFWTKEHHDNYHTASDETRKKNSDSVKASRTPELRKHLSEMFSGERNPMYGKRGELAPCYGRCGELHPMYGKESPFKGKHHTDESKQKISEAAKNRPPKTEEDRKKISESIKRLFLNEEFVKKRNESIKNSWDEERRNAASKQRKEHFGETSMYYKEYCKNGGTIKWQKFQKYFNEYKRSSINHSIDDFLIWINKHV